jgi:hypothetical protein
MDTAHRHSALGSTATQRLLVLAGAALVTALLFGGVFEILVHLTNWILANGVAHFERIHPLLRLWVTMFLALVWILPVAAIVMSRHSRTRRHRALRRGMSGTL